MSPRGRNSATFVTGRYSNDLPTRLAARYRDAEHDPELLSMRSELALIDSRIGDVLTRIDSGESGHTWRLVQERWDEYQTQRGRPGEDHAYGALADAIEHGLADYAAWSDVRGLIDQRQRVVESERKRLIDMQQTMTYERAMLLVSAVADIVQQHVPDSATRVAISRDIGRILGPDPQATTRPVAP